MGLLNAHDIACVEAAIEAVEARSAGELVVAVVGRCDRYDLPRSVCAGAWALAVMLLAGHGNAAWGHEFLLLAQIPLWLLFWFVLGLRPILRRLSGGLHTDRVVRRRAMQLFMAHGLFRTRQSTGLLIMISELERRVVILGDVGIHARIGNTGWQAHVDAIVAGIKRGETGAAVVSTLEALGETLAAHFPPQASGTNELSNRVIIEA